MTTRQPSSEPLRVMVAAGIAVTLVCIILDQASKWLVTSTLARGQAVTLAPFLDIVHQRNPSGAFGLFASLPEQLRLPVLLALGLVAVVAILALSIHWLRPSRALAVYLGLVLGGALSNLADRIWQGEVIDFIDLYAGAWHWPTFNLADTTITFGSLLLLSLLLRGGHKRELAADGAPAPGSEADWQDSQGGR